jgi:Mrp family chromosome partitioning ATPase
MDKIQDAIAKARATRAQQPGATGSSAASKGNALWQALPSHTPSQRRLARNRIVAVETSRRATDFDVIRTRLLQQMQANNWKRVAITSPTAGCGKSTMVMNIAFSLARMEEHRTIVAEVDMRRPSLAKSLGLPNHHRFADVLAGHSPFEEHAARIGDNLVFTTNDGPVHASAELLQSARTGQTLDEIERLYAPTVMLFDTPPMMTGDDTMAFLSRVDCVLIIAAAEQSSIKQIDNCERDIASQTNVMGVILNKCRYIDPDKAYGYYG